IKDAAASRTEPSRSGPGPGTPGTANWSRWSSQHLGQSRAKHAVRCHRRAVGLEEAPRMHACVHSCKIACMAARQLVEARTGVADRDAVRGAILTVAAQKGGVGKTTLA